MKRHVPFIVIALLMSLFLVTVASAAVRCVSALPVAGCPSYPTIQDAVNNSGSGDTIVVTPGVYYENVTIPGGLSNLTIQGGIVVLSRGRLSVTLTTPDQVVVDARPEFETCTGPAFYIDQAKNITIKNLTVRHACGEGIFISPDHSTYGQYPYGGGANIFSTGDFTKIDKVNSYASQEEGVFIGVMSGNQTSAALTEGYCLNAPGSALIQNSIIIGNQGMYAVGVFANNAVIQTNSIWNNAGGGIFVEGCKPLVKGNDLRQNLGYDCIHVCEFSDYAQVTGNSIYECGQAGIVAHGYYDGYDFYPLISPTISGNTIRGIGGYINLLTETAPNILGAPIFSQPMTIFGSGISAYEVANATISSNNIAGTFILGIALEAYNSTISNNTLTAPGFVGICAGGMEFISAVASGNKNTSAPNVSQSQYNYGNKITSNKVEGAIFIGIAAEGAGLAVTSNSVTHPAYLYLDYQMNGGRTFGQFFPPEQMYSGYMIECYSGGVIDRNTVTNSGWNGFLLYTDECNVTGNTAEHITNTGFYAYIYGGTMSGNTARYCGSYTLLYPEGPVEQNYQQGGTPPGIFWDSNGFDIDCIDCFLNRNTAEFNTGRGFILYSYGITNIAANISRKNYRTGVRLEYATGTLNFTGNSITDNHGEGIANFAPNDGGIVKILNNTAQRNRTDICNEGTATFTGNICTQPNCNTIQPECDLEIPLPD